MSHPPKSTDSQDHIAYYSAQIAAEPDNERWLYERGRWRVASGDLAGAIQDLSESLRRKPGMAWPHYQRGRAYEASGDLDAAAADYQQALDCRIRASGWQFFRALGRVEMRRGNRDAARAALDEALRHQPDDPETRALRAELDASS